MEQQTVKPEKITKPIQLLAAWLAGLLSIDVAFLVAATRLDPTSWQSSLLVVAAVLNVPIFLGAVFLLQTRFRPELQEDSFYSSYLSRKTNQVITLTKEESQFGELRQKVAELELKFSDVEVVETSNTEHVLSRLRVGVNKHFKDKDQISAKLAELGVLGVTVFGSGKHPGQRTVAVAEYLRPEVVREIVGVAKQLGFTHYTLFDNKAEEADEEVLFGSYGEAKYEIAA